MSYSKRVQEIASRLGITNNKAKQLIGASSCYAKIQERWCSEEMTDSTRERVERLEKALEEQIKAIALTGTNVERVKLDGDPRGFTVKAILKDRAHNSWGGEDEGWGIA